ncbi:MAG TPA: response regulator transcription factor [Actinomycetota bacterium]|nr:response regulator transcription factor [Actinomycetota bacterium]
MSDLAEGALIRVVVVDDHPSYAKGLQMLLASELANIDVVGLATSGADGLDVVGKLLPDVVLMDIRMPGLGGIETTRLIKEQFPVVKVVMLTVSEEDQDVYDAMRLGASGYLPKQIEVEDLVSAIRSIHAGQVVISPLVAGKLLGHSREEDVPLTDGDRELLRLVAEGYDNAKIAETLSVSESTLKRNLRNILEKLQLHNRVQAAVYAAKKGWI